MRLAAAAVAAALCAGAVRRGAPEFALLLTLAAGCWVLLSVLDAMGAVLTVLDELARLSGLSTTVVEPVIKVAALSILTHITGEVCRCAGEGGLAAFVETAGTILALAATAPLAGIVIGMVGEMLA